MDKRQIAARFEEELENSSEHVKQSRAYYARKFLDFAPEDLSQWNKGLVNDFLKRLKAEGYAPGTCRNLYGICKRCFDAAKAAHESERTKLISEVNPSDPTAVAEILKAMSMPGPVWDLGKRASPKVESRDMVRPSLTLEEIGAMVGAAKRGLLEPPAVAYLALASVYGLRREELIRVRPEHINYDSKVIFVMTAKGGEQRGQLLANEIIPYLKAYDFQANPSLFGMSQMYGRIEYKAGLVHKDGGGWHCLPAGTLILTRRDGYKEVENLQIGEEVISEKGRFTKIVETFKHEYDGDLVRVFTKGILPFEITPNHPVLVARIKRVGRKQVRRVIEKRWVSASDLAIGDYLIMPRLQKRANGSYRAIDLTPYVKRYGWGGLPKQLKYWKRGSITLNKETAYILGRWVADGSSSKGQATICFNSLDTVGLAKTRLCVEEGLGFKVREFTQHTSTILKGRRVEGEATNLLFGGRVLDRFFKSVIGHNSHAKRIPKEILLAEEPEVVSAFLEGYFDGDGYRRSTIEASTVCKGLAQQLQMLLTRVGCFGALSNPPSENSRYKLRVSLNKIGRRSAKCKDKGKWATVESIKASAFYWDLRRFYCPIKRLDRVHYQGTVHNIETEEGSYTLNGVTVHNSIRRYLDTELVDACNGLDHAPGELYAHFFLRWKLSGSMVEHYYSRSPLELDARVLSVHPVVALWR